MSTAPQVVVTLKKSQTYIHHPTGLRFEYDVPKIVSAEVAEHLFEHAVRSVKIKSGGQTTRSDIRLFDFAPVDNDEEMEEADPEPGPATLADALAGATPVKPAAVAETTPAPGGAAPGGDGQARSRARGAPKAAGKVQA